MTSPGRGDLGGIDNEALDFSQLEEYINDESENNIYFHDALVVPELKLPEPAKDAIYVTTRKEGRTSDPEATDPLAQAVSNICMSAGDNAPIVPNHHTKNCVLPRTRSINGTSSFTKPHHLPDSPPDSGSEPPFSPPNEDPKLRCPSGGSIDMLHHHHQHHHQQHQSSMSVQAEGLKHYMAYGHPLPLKHEQTAITSSTSPNSASSSPRHHNHHHHHHHHHQSPIAVSPISVHSSHSTSMPVLSTSSSNALTGQLMGQIQQNILSPFAGNALQQQLLAPPGTHMGHLYAGGDEFVYENLSSPVTSTTTSKKRKLPESPKSSRSLSNGSVQVKTEPILASPDPSQGSAVVPSSEEEYSFDLSSADPNGLFVDSSYQCIRFQSFQQNTWAQLLDKDMKEISCPNFRVDADKGFNYSNADESFVCQKKNHFQVTVHVQPLAQAHYVSTTEGTKPIEKFSLHFHGVKMESPSQTIKVEQSQSDRSKRPFHPVPLEMVTDQVTKTTVGRLHFSETTSNNMRKKGKPNPDQRFFFLVVSLCAHVTGDVPCTVVAHASEKIIVRASNPGQFENDMELSWQKGHTLDSIFHNGRVGINTDRPEESLVVHGNIKVTGHILQPSDLRAKFDIQELDSREQLKNVTNLRIVRYRYLPEFGEQVGLSQLSDAGVIAQEVQNILPDAVMEAGDVLLNDGQLIEKLLVVNKERIFMENVGAVKELCKVTDNLENRIEELERINKKLSSMRRKDSLKSTSTDNSRMSSLTSHDKRRSHRSPGKQPLTNHVTLCSSHFVQSTIVILVFIMAFCLVALATLYIMEWQHRHNSPIFSGPVVVQLKSSSPRNSTTHHPEKISIMTTLFPTSLLLQETSPGDLKHISSRSTSHTNAPKGRSPSPLPPVRDDHTDSYGFHPADVECLPGECPIFCCDLYPDITPDEETFPDVQESERPQRHVEKKRSGGNTFVDSEIHRGAKKGLLMDRHQHTDLSGQNTGGSSMDVLWKESEQPQQEQVVSSQQIKKIDHTARGNLVQKLRSKRMVASEEEETEEKDSLRKDYPHLNPILHLLELNATLSPERCSEDRTQGSSVISFSCHIYISRHFSLPNVTLHFRSEESDLIVEFCGGSHFVSCPRDVLLTEKTNTNVINKRETVPQIHSWQLPVGSYIRSRYRFRTMERSVFASDQELCSITGNQHSYTEYILTFQRRCDK